MKIDDKGGVTLQEILDANGNNDCAEFHEMIGKMLYFRGECRHDGTYNGGLSFDAKMYYGKLGSTVAMKPFLDKYPRALEWLLEKGLVEKEEATYKLGQRFLLYHNEYLLTICYGLGGGSDYLQLSNLKTGHVQASAVRVNDINRVTESEMDQISGFSIYTLVTDK